MSDVDSKKATRDRLTGLRDFLKTQSAFEGDAPSWAVECISEYLDGRHKTLDHAFGLRSDNRGPKPMTSGTHDDWVVNAWNEVRGKTPEGKGWPNTKTLATIGRYYGLGGKNNAAAEDGAVASELKRILARYRPIIIKQVSDELTRKLETKAPFPHK